MAGEMAVTGVRGEETELLRALHAREGDIQRVLASCSDHWGYEDPVYRFYHQSFKVFGIQGQTEAIVTLLRELAPKGTTLNSWFAEIVRSGTGRTFGLQDNARWLEVSRPMLEAFFHARYFLEMAARYASLPTLPSPLPSGYAALLYLYGLR